jgi:hypothetical protein
MIGLTLLWLGITVGYCWLHSSVDYVWDDSPKICVVRHGVSESHELFNRRTILTRAFRGDCRPLHHLQEYITYYLYADPHIGPGPWIALGGTIVGLMSVATYLVARRFTRSTAGALLAVFLLLFSTPFITGSWPVIFSIQAVVPLSLCVGLLAYWRAVASAGLAGRIGWTAVLVAVMFLAPWYREFAGLLPLLILWLEAKRLRRPTYIMALAAGCFLHALYPTALLTWTFFSDLPIKSVFNTGQLVGVLDSSPALPWWKRHFQGLKWEVPSHFLVLFPPLLLILAYLGYLAKAAHGLLSPERNPNGCMPNEGSASRSWGVLPSYLLLGRVSLLSRLGKAAIPIAYLGTGIVLLLANAAWVWWSSYFILGITLISWQANSLLGVWFLLSFLPFLKVFTEQVHLGYAVLPAGIGIACAIEHLVGLLACLTGCLRALRYAAAAVLTIALSDHALNLYGSYQTVTAIDHTVHELAGWFRSNVPAGAIVVSNALHLQDIRLASGGYIQTYWTVNAGIPHQESALSDPARLEALLCQSSGVVPVYFLDMDYPYLPEKTYHAHKYVRNRSVEMDKVGTIGVLRVRYPYLDPLKAWVPRRFVSFMGGPDLENDFYHGPAQDGSSFLREVYVEYHLYRVTGTQVAPSSAQPSASMLLCDSVVSPSSLQKRQQRLPRRENK